MTKHAAPKGQTATNPEFPGIQVTTDGSGGIVWGETAISQSACAYPITPTTNMGVSFAAAVANGKKNLWGDTLLFLEAESEHSSASSSEGFALAGGRVSNFTSGQGLILMKEVLYVISGKRLPVVFNIGARAMTSQSLNIHAGHDDVMGVADVGWGMVFARNAQETTDLNIICRRVAEETHTPFMNVQDGFLTTHTLETIRLPEEELMKRFVGSPAEKLKALFDPIAGTMAGVVTNQDAYMRGKIAQRAYYEKITPALRAAMADWGRLTGRNYGLVGSHRMEDAEYAIVALGSTAETAEAVVDHLRETRGMKVGVVHPYAFRPFPAEDLVQALKNVKAMAVIERLDIPLADSNPLTAELKAAFSDALTGAPGMMPISRIPAIVSGVAGLGSRDVRPGDLVAVFEHLAAGQRRFFTLNVDHPTALPVVDSPDIRPKGSFSMRGYSIGGFGSVTTNKVIATVSEDLFGVSVQANSLYGSEKKGLPTNYYLTLGPERIRAHCEMEQVDLISLNDANAMFHGNPFYGLSKGGAVFIQSHTTDPAQLWEWIPGYAKEILLERQARVFYVDTQKIATEEAVRPDLIIRMQGIALLGVFLKVVPYPARQNISEQALFEGVKKGLVKYFGSQSEKVVNANLRCVERGYQELKELPQEVMTGAGKKMKSAV
ncbi:MAG: 2-oxoacid:acceptor oxidoreductase family protein [Deltaproteobacteria bacterium]|nr:2-oxoacid:acceptor oxidoreductase family protein [Deltaproteobacteria bacterium]